MSMKTNTSVDKKYSSYDLEMPAEEIKDTLKGMKDIIDDNMVDTDRIKPGTVTEDRLDGEL